MLGVAGVLALWLPNRQWQPPPRPENVILIMVDTLRADHLGTYGYHRDTSPNLDRFAQKSTVFETAYSHSPWTMPSTASIFTSLPPRDHGIVSWRQPMSRKLLTIAEHIRDNGFHTEGYVSHVIFRPRYHYNQGFIEYDDSALDKGPSYRVSTAAEISDAFIASLNDDLPQPFFAWLHYFDPHSWYLTHEPYNFGKRPVDRYDSEIRYTDEQIGRVFDELTARDLWRNTVVVFIADHGEEFGDHGGKKHTVTLYDELIHIPLVIYVPGAAGGERIETVVSESDVAPTICELLDIPVPEQFTGQPFAFNGNRFHVTKHRQVIAETLRKADKRAVREERWKYIEDRENNETMLFDMDADPRERRDVEERHPEVARRLQKLIDDHYGVKRRQIEKRDLNKHLQEQLRALGYLN